jgi:hypothetical protein
LSSAKLLLRIASFLNALTLFLPWWSKFEIYNRIHSDAFLFGFLKYYVDEPPITLILPSSRGSLLFEEWSATYLPFMLVTMVLICVGSFCYVRASIISKGAYRTEIAGCLLSTGALTIFVLSIISFNESGGFVGAIQNPSWVDWGPDIGFFLMLFSTTVALIGLFTTTKALRIRIRVRDSREKVFCLELWKKLQRALSSA